MENPTSFCSNHLRITNTIWDYHKRHLISHVDTVDMSPTRRALENIWAQVFPRIGCNKTRNHPKFFRSAKAVSDWCSPLSPHICRIRRGSLLKLGHKCPPYHEVYGEIKFWPRSWGSGGEMLRKLRENVLSVCLCLLTYQIPI